MTRSRIVTIIAVAVALVASAALYFGNAGKEESVSDQARAFDDALTRVLDSFVDKSAFTADDLLGAALRGLIEELDDPYSAYTTPELYDVSFNYSGQFEGIGAEVTMRDGQVLIQSPLDGSPAEIAGLLPGDIILSVDGTSIDGMTLLEAVALIRGPKGTTVVLSILRAGSLDAMDVPVVRDTITLTSITSRVVIDAPHIGYVRLSTFEANSPQQLRLAIEKLRAEGAQALVLDLRNNSGGLVDAAVGVLSEFLDGGLMVALVDAEGDRREFMATEGGSALDIPLAVLVNAFSASASELAAAALQDYGRATILGSRTFGKGSFNTVYQLDNAGGLYLTTGRWLSPDGRLIEGEGLEPDVQVGPVVDTRGLLNIGREVRSLCDASAELEGDAGGSQALLDAVRALCAIEPAPADDDGVDEALEAAIGVLDADLGR